MAPTGSVVMVRGPATVRVDGACRILGMDVSNSQVTVRAGKVLPFEIKDETKTHIEPGGGMFWTADPLTSGTSMWQTAVERILSARQRVVMLVGRTDTGKSTFSTYLANVAIERGLVPCIIDGDMGQGDLAPPGAVGAAIIRRQLTDLRDARADFFEFVGSLTPAGFERIVAGRLRSLLLKTRRLADLQIINTDGYVENGGLPYKLMIARVLRPAVLVCLGPSEFCNGFGSEPWMPVRVKSSREAVKTRSDRLGRRATQLLHYTGDGLTSKELADIWFVYRNRQYSWDEVTFATGLCHADMKGMFVGLGFDGRIAGFGIIQSIEDGRITVKTSLGNFDRIHLSNIFPEKDRSGPTVLQKQDP